MRDEYDFSKGKKRPVIADSTTKERITIRVDQDILKWFKDQCAGGGNYQSLINQALRQHIDHDGIKKEIRTIVGEELKLAQKSVAE